MIKSAASLEQAGALFRQGRWLTALATLRSLPIPDGKAPLDAARAELLTARVYNVLLKRDSAPLYAQRAVDRLASLRGKQKAEYWKAVVEWGNVLSATGKFSEGIDQIQKSLDYYQAGDRADSPEAAYALQTLSVCLARRGEVKEAFPYARQALDIYRRLGDRSSLAYANNQAFLGYLLWQLDDYGNAITHFQEAEQFFLREGGPTSDWLAPLYINFGACYDEMGYSERAIVLYEKAEPIFRAQNDRHPLLASLFNNLGNACGGIGEFTQAVDYLEAAIARSPQARYYNNLGNVFLEQGDQDQAEKNFTQALEKFLAAARIDSNEVARPYHNLAIIYRERGDWPKSREFEQRSLPFRKAGKGLYQMDVARTFRGLAECAAALSEPEQALIYLDSALLIQDSLLPSGRHPELALTFLGKARVFQQLGNDRQTAAFLDSALVATGYRDGGLEEVLSWSEFLSVMGQRAHFYRRQFLEKNDADALSASLASCRAIAGAIDRQRQSLVESASKTRLIDSYYPLLEGAIRTTLTARQTGADPPVGAEAFTYAEQSKALVLLEGLRSADALRFAGIPDALLEQERALREEIDALDMVRMRKLNGGEELSATEKDRLFQARQKHGQLQARLERDFPAYYRLKYDLATVSVGEVQRELLQPGQGLLTYFVGDSSIFLFLITPDSYRVEEVKKDFPLEDWVQQMRYGLTAYHGFTGAGPRPDTLRGAGQWAYADAAYRLYEKLLAPVRAHLPPQLIIVPDGPLGYLPFEALLTQPTAAPHRYATHRYLLEEQAISYAYSATLLREMQTKRHRQEPAEPFLAFAPYYRGDTTLLAAVFPDEPSLRKSLDPLPFSGEEALGATRLLGGRALVGEEATEERFVELAGRARILHLATHGQANDRLGDYCFLAFSEVKDSLENELLYVRDIYNLELNADLVTLSACETGIGELRRGEGIISLARAFAYAGARSIVTSLWSVKDAQTKELMLDFYRHLQEGKPKDLALRQAKLDLISRYKRDEGGYPFFWAGFIAVGDAGPVSK